MNFGYLTPQLGICDVAAWVCVGLDPTRTNTPFKTSCSCKAALKTLDLSLKPAMNLSLQFTDSEILALASTRGALHIRMSAAHVSRPNAKLHEKPTDGFSRGVELVLSGARHDTAMNTLIGRLSQGRIRINGQWSPSIPLPHTHPGPVKLELSFANQSFLALEADGVECRFEGEPNFHESMAC